MRPEIRRCLKECECKLFAYHKSGKLLISLSINVFMPLNANLISNGEKRDIYAVFESKR